MRRFAGWILFIAGTVGLGFWAHQDIAPKIETEIRDDIARLPLADDVTVMLSGRDIAVSGVLGTHDDVERTLEMVGLVRGHRVIQNNLTIRADQ